MCRLYDNVREIQTWWKIDTSFNHTRTNEWKFVSRSFQFCEQFQRCPILHSIPIITSDDFHFLRVFRFVWRAPVLLANIERCSSARRERKDGCPFISPFDFISQSRSVGLEEIFKRREKHTVFVFLPIVSRGCWKRVVQFHADNNSRSPDSDKSRGTSSLFFLLLDIPLSVRDYPIK